MVILAILAVLAVMLLVMRRSGGRRPAMGPSREERALIDRAATGDGEAARELGRLAASEEAALRARAATDPHAAALYRDRKETQLKALQWAEESLDRRGTSAGYSAEQAAAVRARISGQLAEVSRDLDWIRERTRGG